MISPFLLLPSSMLEVSSPVTSLVLYPVRELVLGQDGVGVEKEVVVGGRWRVAEQLLRALPAAEDGGELRELPLRRLPHRLQLFSGIACSFDR